ncbi:MAG TPA: transglycosylase family protein [Pseudonocardiaceae bacterium]
MAKHRRSSSTGRTVARLALAGLVAGAPLALAAPAQAAPNWDALAQCESGGRWNINTGNGYSGGLQFSPSTWRAYGGTQYAPSAAGASREQQIAIAERVLAGQGPGAWPACTRKTGWNNGGGAAAAPAKKAAPKKAAPKKAAPKKPAAAPAAAAPKSGADYTVKPGDTLSKIAAEQGVAGGWSVIFDRNRDIISDPNLIFPNQQIDLR